MRPCRAPRVSSLGQSQVAMSKFLKDRRSVTALEYALLGAAMGLVLVTVLRLPVENLAGAVSRFVAAMHAPPSGP